MIMAENMEFSRKMIKNLSGDDVREGLVAVVSVKLTDAQFEGQTKGKLGNTDMGQMVSQMIYEKLMTFFRRKSGCDQGDLCKSIGCCACP